MALKSLSAFAGIEHVQSTLTIEVPLHEYEPQSLLCACWSGHASIGVLVSTTLACVCVRQNVPDWTGMANLTSAPLLTIKVGAGMLALAGIVTSATF